MDVMPAGGEITQKVRVPDYLSFLRNAATEINSSLDYQKTLQNVANAMVPTLSDWCAVDIIEDGVFRRLAIAHPDPKKKKLAQELNQKYPPKLGDKVGSPQVIATGVPLMANNIPDDNFVKHAKDKEHLRLLRALDFRSLLIYPIRSHEKVLGSLTFVWSKPGHTYSLSDIAFVETLSLIAGNAIENALLVKTSAELGN